MNMGLGWILLLLIGTELWLLVKIGAVFGALNTILLLIGAGFLGMAVLRYQGASALMRFQHRMHSGESPASDMLEGMLLAVAGVLLMLPGFLSDIVALVLLIPPFRRLLAKSWLKNRAVVRAKTAQASNFHSRQPDVIEGEFRRED